METKAYDFESFMKQRQEASSAFVNGDVKPLLDISTHTSPATLFGPTGNYVQGADAVNSTNEQSASMFNPGSTNSFEIFHMASDETVGYWVGIQHSTVHMQGHNEPIPMHLRITEVFRRENNEWKLIHRHADNLKESDQR